MAGALPIGLRGRILALALTAAVLGVAWLAVAAPLLAWHAERAETLAQRRLLAQRMELTAAALPQLRRAQAGSAASPAPRALLEGASDAIAGAALQARLEALAAQEGLSLASTEALAVEASGAYRRVGLRLVLTGPWPALVRLLEAVGKASPRMLVDDIQLQAAPSVAAGAAQPVGAAFTVIAFRAGGAG